MQQRLASFFHRGQVEPTASDAASACPGHFPVTDASPSASRAAHPAPLPSVAFRRLESGMDTGEDLGEAGELGTPPPQQTGSSCLPHTADQGRLPRPWRPGSPGSPQLGAAHHLLGISSSSWDNFFVGLHFQTVVSECHASFQPLCWGVGRGANPS